MEVVAGGMHVQVPMDHASRVGEARRLAADISRDAGFDDVEAGRLALVVTELGANLQRHARDGMLLIGASAGGGEVQVIAYDRGPGIADLPRSLGDGYSTGGTPGTGLGGVRRLADDFDIHSSVPDGTIVVARVRARTKAPVQSDFRAAGISVAAPGEVVCGDSWRVAVQGSQAAVLVADGLGHGPDAAEAAEAAVTVFEAEPAQSPVRLIETMHARLRSTRGAAVSLFRIDAGASQIRTASAGNVVGRMVSGVTDKVLLGQHGTVGLQMRNTQEIGVEWPPHALLVVHSDGLETRWSAERLLPVLGLDPAIAATLLLRDHCRGRDDATVVVVGRSR